MNLFLSAFLYTYGISKQALAYHNNFQFFHLPLMYFKNIKKDSWIHIKVKNLTCMSTFSFFLKEIQGKVLNLF